MPKLIKAEEFELSNGIPVVLQHYDAPVAATYWWVRTGSADEGKNEEGFAHFLEHMLFKDAAAKETGRASTGQMARAIESLGGDINAYTSFDQTVYHVTCAAHHWERVLDAFGTMAKPQRFLKTDFEREREVILEELRRSNDSPGRQLFQSLFSTTFGRHPYGRPVIGFEKTLRAATPGQLESFYKRSYSAARMGIILVGPVGDASSPRRKAIIKLLEKRFGKNTIPPAKKNPQAVKRPQEPALRKEIGLKKKSFDVKTPTLAISFRIPDLKHPDVPALDLMSGVLGMGELSRMYQRLFYQTSLATDAGGGMYIPIDPGMLYFQAEMESVDRLEKVAEEMFRELDRIKREGATAEELERVLVNSESERLYATQTVDGMAGRLGFLKFVLGNLDFDREYIEELRAVDNRKIRSVAEEYLDYRRMGISVLLPKDQAEYDITPIRRMAERMLAPAGDVAKSQAKVKVKSPSKRPGKLYSELRPEIITLPSGLRVVHRENVLSHVVSIHAGAMGGLRLELGNPIESRERDWGASYMMALSWTKGTRTRDARAIASVIEGHAASMDGYAGRNTVGLQLTGLARDWSELSETFAEVLIDSTFPESEVDHSRRVAEDSVRGIEDHSSQLCSKLFLETLFESHPYGHLTTGSLESLKHIDTNKLQAFHRAWIRPERLVLSVVGAVRRADLDHWLEELSQKTEMFARGTSGRKLSDSIQPEPPLRAPRWVERSLGREQTHIMVGGLGSTIGSPDRHALRLLQTILGGQSGRLFLELRERKSLAYTVAPLNVEGVEPGYIGTYIACAPQKKDEAIAGMRAVLEKLASKGPTASEMARAKEFYLGRRAMDLQSDSSMAAHYGLEELYGLPHLDEQEVVKKIQSVTAKQVQEVCRKYLVEPHMVTSVVG